MTSKITTPSIADLTKRLNSRIRENPAWLDLFRSTSRVINEYVTRNRTELATVRDPKRFRRGDWTTLADGDRVIVNHVAINDTETVIHAQRASLGEALEFTLDTNRKERRINQAGASFHGFQYFSDTLSDEDYARVHEWVERYWPESGTNQFARFIGFIKNMKLEVDQLYSDVLGDLQGQALTDPDNVNDQYPYLEPDPDDNYVWAGGTSYPTSHVQLRYDAILSPTVDETDLYFLFYYLAPIHLVLHRIVAEITHPPLPIIRVPAIAPIGFHEMGLLRVRPEANLDDRYVVQLPPIGVSQMAYLDVNTITRQQGSLPYPFGERVVDSSATVYADEDGDEYTMIVGSDYPNASYPTDSYGSGYVTFYKGRYVVVPGPGTYGVTDRSGVPYATSTGDPFVLRFSAPPLPRDFLLGDSNGDTYYSSDDSPYVVRTVH